MNNPLQRLGQLPWLPLFWVALLTLFWASVLELLLVLGAQQVGLIANAVTMLFTPPLATIMMLAIAIGIGALAVVFLEIIYPQILITAGVLWALVLCVLLATLLRSVLPISTSLLSPAYPMLIGNILGIFLKGKPYWKSHWR